MRSLSCDPGKKKLEEEDCDRIICMGIGRIKGKHNCDTTETPRQNNWSELYKIIMVYNESTLLVYFKNEIIFWKYIMKVVKLIY